MCKITEKILFAHCLDCPVIIKHNIFVNWQNVYFLFLFCYSVKYTDFYSNWWKNMNFLSFNCSAYLFLIYFSAV